MENTPLSAAPLEALAAAMGAPAAKKPLRQQQCGPLGLKILRDGTWLYQNSPIGRKELVKLFASVLSRDDEGVHWMTTPAERGTVEVEEVAFVAVELTIERQGQPDQALSVRTNIDQWVMIGPDHPLRVEQDLVTGEPSPYVYVGKGLEAKINRAVFYQLVDLAEAAPPSNKSNEQEWVGVWSQNTFFPLGQV